MDADTLTIPLGHIMVDLSLQPRIGGLDAAHVQTLQDAVDSWPPVVVIQQAGQYLLIDGFHRYAAAQNLGLDTVPVVVIERPDDGDLAALAFRLNAAHGRPLTLTDRRAEAARLLLLHSAWSDREIGRRCGLAQPTVAKVRTDLETNAQIEQNDTRIGRGGYTYTVGTNERLRQSGDLPDTGLGEQLGDTLGRLFTSEERRQQRHIVHYLQRLAVALEDQDDLDGWNTTQEAADACRLVLGEERAADLADRLGWSSLNVLDVATALGYDDHESSS